MAHQPDHPHENWLPQALDPSVWDTQRIQAACMEADAAVLAAHGDAGPVCALCPACTTYHRLLQQVIPALAREVQAQGTDMQILREQYAALHEAHATLQLEYEDLQAAYYVAQRALRGTKEDSEQA